MKNPLSWFALFIGLVIGAYASYSNAAYVHQPVLDWYCSPAGQNTGQMMFQEGNSLICTNNSNGPVIGSSVGMYGATSGGVSMFTPLPGYLGPTAPNYTTSTIPGGTPPTILNNAQTAKWGGFTDYASVYAFCTGAYGASEIIIRQDTLATVTGDPMPAASLECSNAAKTTFPQIYPYSVTCPAGYAVSGIACNLTNQAIVVRPLDGVVIAPAVTGASPSVSTQPDLDTAVAGAPVASGATVTATDSIHGVTTTNTVNNNNTTTITDSVSNITNNTTTTSTIIINTTSGLITGTNSTTTQGVGTAASGTPLSTAQQTNGATSADIAALSASNHADALAQKNGQCGGVGEPACRIDETGTPTNSTTTGGTDLTNGMTAFPAAVAAVQPAFTAPAEADWYNPFSSLPTATCEPLVIPGWGSFPSMSINLCPMVSTLQPLIDWFLWASCLLYCWFRYNSIQSGVAE